VVTTVARLLGADTRGTIDAASSKAEEKETAMSVWHWAVSAILFLVMAYAGKAIIRPNSPKQRVRSLQAFGVGAGLIVLSYALRTMTGEVAPLWRDVGWWIDVLAEAVIAGLFIGGIVALFFRRRAAT
jgi:predicted cation transporter